MSSSVVREVSRENPAPGDDDDAPVFDRFVRRPEVEFRTGLKRSTMYSYIKQGRFPQPIPLGTPRAVAWLSSEIDAWIETRVRAARHIRR